LRFARQLLKLPRTLKVVGREPELEAFGRRKLAARLANIMRRDAGQQKDNGPRNVAADE
jgi:hypothetical protein